MYSVPMDEDNNKLHRTYKGLSKLLLEFNLDFDNVCKTLREYYVLEAFAVSKTITRTSLKVGIDRRTVSAIIKNKKQYHKPSSIFTILNRIKILSESSDGLVEKHGEDSVESIIMDVAHGATTMNSVINELAELGCIKDLGEKIKFVTSHISKTPGKQRSLQILSNHMDRYIDTVVSNLHCEIQEDRNFEYSIYSTRIPPDVPQSLHEETRNILTESTNKLRSLYEEYDQDVPTGTYEERGVSLTQFNLNKKEE